MTCPTCSKPDGTGCTVQGCIYRFMHADPAGERRVAEDAVYDPDQYRDVPLQTIRDVVQSWIDWQYRDKAFTPTDDSKVMIVPKYPSVGVLKNWVKAINDSLAELENLRTTTDDPDPHLRPVAPNSVASLLAFEDWFRPRIDTAKDAECHYWECWRSALRTLNTTHTRTLIAFTLSAIGYDGKTAPFTDRADQVEVILKSWKERSE